ncbi:MAG: ABC transporter substrate-binding protein [Alphaproteobacteria bacterium]|nr:ABC transporter substrate-binding protein [Alphaproteobacteria bacterium]
MSLAAPAQAVDAETGDAAVAFVGDLIDHGISALSDDSLTRGERHEKLRQTFHHSFATDDIARLSLGPYWRGASAEDRISFIGALGRFFSTVLLRNFPGGDFRTFSTVDTHDTPEGHLVTDVNTVFVSQNISTPILWSVGKKNGEMKIVDVAVGGHSLIFTQRDKFEETLRSNGGSIPDLVAAMAHFALFSLDELPDPTTQ